jgi:hypothetical protein
MALKAILPWAWLTVLRGTRLDGKGHARSPMRRRHFIVGSPQDHRSGGQAAADGRTIREGDAVLGMRNCNRRESGLSKDTTG